MAKFRRILYLERRARGSSRAVECAVRVAASHGAELTVAGAAGVRLEPLMEVAARHDVPARMAAGHWLPGRTRTGGGGRWVGGLPPGTCGEYDLLITVGRGRARSWTWDDRVVHELVCEGGSPVWVLHPAQGPSVRVVVAAVELPSEGDTLSRRVLRTAADLAADATLHVVHFWWVRGESLLVDRSRGGSPEAARRVLAATEQSHRELLQRFLESEDVSAQIGLRRAASVPTALREEAWRLEADVVVVGASDRSGLAERILGHTAERLIGRVPASVLVVPEPDPASAEEAPESSAEESRRAGPRRAFRAVPRATLPTGRTG